ncbi:hypothetical protein Golomagni_02454 [Golovinomyces magnicellulatus]|nr:hypothetical protein Golomagni_02454 [Golovinomyces magnicellulatus]
MLEGLVASLLNRFLGLYIRNFDPKQLNIGIWSGDVKLRDLELRREALDQLKLPINVTKGHLGELTLRIPWSNLRGQPVQVHINDVYVLAVPKRDVEWDDEEEEAARRYALKMEKLESAEIMRERSQEGLNQEEQQKNQSFAESLATKIVDNLQITIKNIHIRYEDSISAPGHPFAVGVTLQEFSAVSTDSDWKPKFIQNSVGSSHKLANLGALAVYWNTDTKLLDIGTDREVKKHESEISLDEDILKIFKEMISESKNLKTTNHQFILKPINGLAKITMDKSGKIDQPHISAKLIFDEISMILDKKQYRNALMMGDLFHYFMIQQEYRTLRPKNKSPKSDPRAWFIFACNAVLTKIHDRNRRWSWEFFKERRDDRNRYIELFKLKKKQEVTLDASDQLELEKLERKLNYDDLRFWRSLARNQLKKENSIIKKTNTARKNQGWVAWAWGSKLENEEDSLKTVMTEEQRKELYSAIDWDEKSALAQTIDLPKETIKTQISAQLNTGSFTLKHDVHQNDVEVLSLFFDGFFAKFLQRPESFLVEVSLEGLRVNDGTVSDSLFTQIVRVKDAPKIPTKKLLLDEEIENKSSDPFFQIKFEQNPLDGASDLALTGKLKPLEIIWNPQFLVGIMNFFEPPERHMESIEAFMETAGATVENLRQQTRAGLEFALEEHKTLNAILDLQAPLIIIPESITEKRSACLILDAGHISVSSQIVDKKTLKQVQEKQQRSYTDEDYRHLESLMYDKFLVKLSATQLLIGPSLDETKSQIYDIDESKTMHIVEKINIDFMVETSIIPKAPNLAKIRVSGRLPLLHVSASDKKYKSLMRIIDVAVPKFGEESEDKKPLASKKDIKFRGQNLSNTSKKDTSQELLEYTDSLSSSLEVMVIGDVSCGDDNKIQNSTEEKANDTFKYQQHNFELKFEVDKLRGSLFRSGIEEHSPDQLLVELVADKFALGLIVRAYDLKIDTSLRSLTVDDHVENPSYEFQSIISSGDSNSEEIGDLISVNIFIVKKESPEFTSKWNGINVHINACLSTINLIITRKTILTLLDFILVTFTSDDTSFVASRKQIKETENDRSTLSIATVSNTETNFVQIKVDLKSIRMILNNDGTRLATLSLNSTDVGIFVGDNSLRVEARAANLSLLDDMNICSEDSSLRELITIQGDDLADFRYETFDSRSGDTYPGYDSSIYLRAGSIKLNFLGEALRNITGFLVKFGKMQAIFNAARQAAANQASQIQQNASRIKIDINMKTPIVVFPRALEAINPTRDTITAHLGEIYAKNEFLNFNDAENSSVSMKLASGIRNIRLTSKFYFPKDRSYELDLIDRVDLDFIITYTQHIEGIQRPELEVKGNMTDVNLRITQTQLKFMLGIVNSLPSAFAVDSEELEKNAHQEIDQDFEQDIEQNHFLKSEKIELSNQNHALLVDLGPELKINSQNWIKLDFEFHVHTIGLELIRAREDEPIDDLEIASLSRFSLDDTRLKLQMTVDQSIETELLVHSFTIKDSRARTSNKFRKIMTTTNKDEHQFMAKVTISGGIERNLIAILAVDSPKVIFALDYIFAIQAFVNESFAVDDITSSESSNSIQGSDVISRATSIQSTQVTGTKFNIAKSNETSAKNLRSERPMKIVFRANIVDAQIILIANPLDISSDAIVLGTKQILMSQQNAFTLQVSEIGMFLCRMDHFEDVRLRILDNFSTQISLDNSDENSRNITINLEPLVLRLSLRDILLALQIFSKASELSGIETEGKEISSRTKSDQENNSGAIRTKDSTTHEKKVISPMHNSTRVKNSTNKNNPKTTIIEESTLKNEELSATIEGIRIVLIGDLHELPILDTVIRGFTMKMNNWTSNIRASATIELFSNIYNFSKSAWEPLIEPWEVSFLVSKEIKPVLISINLTSTKTLELTVTSATIALASKSIHFLTQKSEVPLKSRGVDAPYRIRNYSGFDMMIWAKETEDENDNQVKLNLKDGDEGPWWFQDWRKMRENLSSEAGNGVVGIKLEGSGFEAIDGIPISREGEYLYCLQPQKNQVLHRILVDVTLGTNNVKYVTVRSPLLIENKTLIPLEIGVFDVAEGNLLRFESIPPGESRPAPVKSAYSKCLLVRPGQGFGYSWSNENIWWRDLLKRPTKTLTCMGENEKKIPLFYFRMHASYNRSNPITSTYPYMKIRISAPIELENLLPYHFKYRIYDKDAKKDWSNFLRKGGVSPVHVVELSHLLLLSIEMQDTPFTASDFSIINTGHQDDFRKETTIVCKDDEGLSLNLCLYYLKIPNSGGAFRVIIYSPYVILNKTGLGIEIKAKSLLSQAKKAAGQGLLQNPAASEGRKALPFMFTFSGDDQRNRAILKVGESSWSRPQSFDAIGSTIEVVLPSATKNTEIHVGITVRAGEGKHSMSKVVTIAPRFILKNRMSEEIIVREPGSSKLMKLKPMDLQPLHFIQKGTMKQLSLCYPGLSNQWSSPFNISDLGITYAKVAKVGERQKLIRVEVLMENATIFLHLSLETNHWPFSIRNESDIEFIFFQADPNLYEDVEDRSGWRPIRYRLTPRSIMPYAWDYPAAKNKELVINAGVVERHIKLAEIGNLIPMKIPSYRDKNRNTEQKFIDLNVLADGPTQTLILSNYRASKSLYKQRSRSEMIGSGIDEFEVKSQDTAVNFHAKLHLAGVGVSLINPQLKELAYITLREIQLKYSESPLYQTVTSSIKWIQIDNQLYGGIFPIILYPSVVPKNTKETESHPSIHCMITRVKDNSYGVLYIKYATILFQQMTLEIDEDFICSLMEFCQVPGASWSEIPDGVLCDESLDIPEPTQDQSGQDIYFELLNIQPMQLDLSFVRTDRVNVDDKKSSKNPLTFFVNVLTMAIGNINDAPVRLNALMIENARVSASVLWQNISSHYSQEALFQVHKVLGSADFLGNPVGLFNNLSSGVVDIFYEPYQGFIMADRPEDLGIGIAKGATSFVKKSIFGVSDSVSKFTGSIAKGLAEATMDKQFQDRRRITRSRNRPKHALYGVTAGANSFVSSLASGVGGLARKPLEGAEEEGLTGFFKGVGKGAIGLITKPAIGIFDLASNVSEGIRNTTTVFDADGLDRVRITRFIGLDGIVRPYSQREALGQFWLKQLDNGKYFNENYIAHLQLPQEDVIVILTYSRIMLVKSKKLTTEWDVPLKNIQTVRKERTGLSFILRGGLSGPFVPIKEESSRNFLYGKIGVAVGEFNQKNMGR